MASISQRQEGPDGALSMLDEDIQVLHDAKDTCGIPPVQDAFGSAGALLTTIRDPMFNKQDYTDLGKLCAGVCKAFDRGLKGRRLDDLSPLVLEAIEQLTTTVIRIQREIVKLGKRNAASQTLHAKNDKDAITAWKHELNRILHVFNTELAITTHMLVVDIHRDMSAIQEGALSQHQPANTASYSLSTAFEARASVFVGESPPPPPRACFGRTELIDEIVGFAERLEPIALIGAGGIGKTSIALVVLHHDRVKKRFGDNRRFIRCDEFPASPVHFLARLSQVVGAAIENPEGLAPLRPFLSSREMILFLDNAESILDPQGTDAREISALVEELSCFKNICLGITSRISTVPPHCKRPIVHTLSMEFACDIFYAIYSTGGRSDIVSDLVKRLDFHALSITLLATTASHNEWDYNRLAEEWAAHQVGMLRTDYNKSLAATIELSLASPTFCQLVPPPGSQNFIASTFGKIIPSLTLRKVPPSPRELLEVVAFFPQGVHEKNLDWLFPTTPDRKTMFDKFCVLSLTHRNNGFITMLSPIRHYLLPPDPKTSPLLCATKNRYFTRLSVRVAPGEPGYEEAAWIKTEDVNVEHLLDVFTSIDTNVRDVWKACGHFMEHLFWYKPRHTALGPKVEDLPDGHRFKPECLVQLSRLFGSAGDYPEQKRLLTLALSLQRERWDYIQAAQTLRFLSDVNQNLGLHREGIEQAEEAFRIYKRFWHVPGQAGCLGVLTSLLLADEKLDAAENTAFRTIGLLPAKGEEFELCGSHRLLGKIYGRKGEKEKAIDHFKTAIGIAAPFNWQDILFWIHLDLAKLFITEDELDNASTNIEQAKSHAVDDAHNQGLAMTYQAWIWYQQSMLENAKSEVLRALEIYEKLGAANGIEDCRGLLQEIEQAMESRSV